MRVFLVRHGQSTENAANLKRLLTLAEFQVMLEEAKDSVLTPLGEEQARVAGHALQSVLPTLLYASPFPRAKQTADIISQALDLPVQVVPGLHEITAAVPTVLRRTRSRSVKSLYIRGYLHKFVPRNHTSHETWRTAKRRVIQVWQELSATWQPDQRIVIVSHRAFIWMTLRYLEKSTPWHIVQRNLHNAGISEVVLPISLKTSLDTA